MSELLVIRIPGPPDSAYNVTLTLEGECPTCNGGGAFELEPCLGCQNHGTIPTEAGHAILELVRRYSAPRRAGGRP